MLLETKLRNNMLAIEHATKHKELEKQGMNDGNGDGRSRRTTKTRNAHNHDNVS